MADAIWYFLLTFTVALGVYLWGERPAYTGQYQWALFHAMIARTKFQVNQMAEATEKNADAFQDAHEALHRLGQVMHDMNLERKTPLDVPEWPAENGGGPGV